MDKLLEVYQEKILQFKFPIITLLVGIFFIAGGFIFSNYDSDNGVVILDDNSVVEDSSIENTSTIYVEISGAVSKPGVYELAKGSRLFEIIDLAGGLEKENSEWVEKYINKAAVLIDGQKIIIPRQDEQLIGESASNFGVVNGVNVSSGDTQNKYVNINTASKTELESLWGIGPVYAQNIIDQRPYSNISELIEKNIIKQNVYDRNKDILSVY